MKQKLEQLRYLIKKKALEHRMTVFDIQEAKDAISSIERIGYYEYNDFQKEYMYEEDLPYLYKKLNICKTVARNLAEEQRHLKKQFRHLNSIIDKQTNMIEVGNIVHWIHNGNERTGEVVMIEMHLPCEDDKWDKLWLADGSFIERWMVFKNEKTI